MKYGVIFLILTFVGLAGFWEWARWRENRYDPQILAAAARYHMDPALVKAVIWQESDFDSEVRGRAGEIGLMQVREAAALEWAGAEHVPAFQHEDCLNPATNTLVGVWYLNRALARYTRADDPVPYALADYNAGRGNVLKWLKGDNTTNSGLFIDEIGFPSTQIYVRSILQRRDHYRDKMK